jgi:hypothetical protein
MIKIFIYSLVYMYREYIKKIIYSSGDVFLPEQINNALRTDLLGSSKKTFYITGWSIIHLLNGIIFGYLYLYFKYDIKHYILNLFILHTLWEIWQFIIGMSKPYNLTGKNNILDIIVDTLLFMCGAYITLKLIYKK